MPRCIDCQHEGRYFDLPVPFPVSVIFTGNESELRARGLSRDDLTRKAMVCGAAAKTVTGKPSGLLGGTLGGPSKDPIVLVQALVDQPCSAYRPKTLGAPKDDSHAASGARPARPKKRGLAVAVMALLLIPVGAAMLLRPKRPAPSPQASWHSRQSPSLSPGVGNPSSSAPASIVTSPRQLHGDSDTGRHTLGSGKPDKRTFGVVTGQPDVRGSLKPAVVSRVINRHINEVKYCYETELINNPNVSGSEVVQFTIAASGQVIASVVQNSTLGNVRIENCVAQAVRRWEFPKPTAGGIVIVSYPFEFRGSGG